MELIPENIPQWLSVLLLNLSVVVIGILAIAGIFDRRTKERQRESQELEDRVRALYKEEVTQQKTEINELRIEVANLKDRSIKMEAENQLMKELLQGRDGDSVQFRERAEHTMELVDKLSEIAVKNGSKTDAVMEAVKSTNKNVERLAIAIEKHLK